MPKDLASKDLPERVRQLEELTYPDGLQVPDPHPAEIDGDFEAKSVSTERASIAERWNFEPGYEAGKQTIAASSAYENEPKIGRVEDTLITVYRTGSSHVNNDGKLVCRRSTDYGDTWGTEITVADGSIDDRNHILILPGDGTIKVLYRTYDASTGTQTGIYTVESTDKGQTWSSRTSFDAFSINAVPSGHSIQTSNGLMITGGEDGHIEAVFSTDDGDTWGSPTTVVDTSGVSGRDTVEPWAAPVSDDGSQILLYGRDTASNEMFAATSTDGGSSWTGPTYFQVGTDADDKIPAVYRHHKNEAVVYITDRSRGRVVRRTLVASQAMERPESLATTSETVIADQYAPSSADFGYPSAVQMGPEESDVLLTWYDDESGGSSPDIHLAGVPESTGGGTQPVVVQPVSIEKTSDQSVSANTVTVVDWDFVESDGADQFDTSTNQFSPVVDGDYLLDFSILASGLTDQDYVDMRVLKNGNPYRVARKIASGTENMSASISTTIPSLTKSDTVTLEVNANAAFSVAGSDPYSWAQFAKR